MKMPEPVAVSICASLLMLNSCATAFRGSDLAPALQLPNEVALDKWVGRGAHLHVTVRFENGEEYPCIIDTGSPTSVLPMSAEPKLGKRIASGHFSTPDRTNVVSHIFRAPKIYLGTTPLVTDTNIGTWDSDIGILGMDCLMHYCIQLDFEAGKLRFLDPEHLNTTALGHPFPIKVFPYPIVKATPFFQKKSSTVLLDLGEPIDGTLKFRPFRRARWSHESKPIPMFINGAAHGNAPNCAQFSECVWEGQSYRGLVIEKSDVNSVGLRFLARHLVTFNFPKGVLYLKFNTADPLK